MSTVNYYFDYNATFPLSKKVKTFLREGDLFFSNPSSLHTIGKRTKAEVLKVTEFLSNFFQLKNSSIFYHSGATEGINTFFKSFLNESYDDLLFLYAKTDHLAVINVMKYIEGKKVEVSSYSTVEDLIKILETNLNKKIILNATWANNESGIIFDIKRLQIFKKKYKNLIVHVDSAQVLGKIELTQFQDAFNLIDAFTFSGHKIGALSGTGFSILNNSLKLHPLIHGGGQQLGLRSGTENYLGILSLKLALEDLLLKAESDNRSQLLFEKKLLEYFKEEIIIVGLDQNRLPNTTLVIFKNLKADFLLTKFDLNHIYVSAGSACSSGSIKGSHVLIESGFEQYKNQAIRFSFHPHWSEEDALHYFYLIEKLFPR